MKETNCIAWTPAVEYANGGKEWWVFGVRHRLDGPAVEIEGQSPQYWILTYRMSKQTFIEIKEKKITPRIGRGLIVLDNTCLVSFGEDKFDIIHDNKYVYLTDETLQVIVDAIDPRKPQLENLINYLNEKLNSIEFDIYD
jgi:hypothetical protein